MYLYIHVSVYILYKYIYQILASMDGSVCMNLSVDMYILIYINPPCPNTILCIDMNALCIR